MYAARLLWRAKQKGPDHQPSSQWGRRDSNSGPLPPRLLNWGEGDLVGLDRGRHDAPIGWRSCGDDQTTQASGLRRGAGR